MRKSFFGFIGLGIIFFCFSFQEKSDYITSDRDGIPIYQACWDEWGRASKNCDGMGLCNYNGCWVWQDDFPCCRPIEQSQQGLLISMDNGDLVFEISLDKNREIDKEPIDKKLEFHVDEEIKIYNEKENWNAILEVGTYTFNDEVGKSGGYLISVRKQ